MMSEVGHDLHTLFPGEASHLHALKVESGPFRGLAERHHLLSREIARMKAASMPGRTSGSKTSRSSASTCSIRSLP
ncbi:hypothetical protein [Sphingopyxis chilensis]